MTERPARSREALLDHIYARGARYRRRRRLARAGLALACVAGLVLVALPFQGSSAGEDQRVVTDEGRERREVERATTPEDGPSTTVGTDVPSDEPPAPAPTPPVPPRPGPTVVPDPADVPDPAPTPPPPAPPARTWTAAPLSGPAGTVITVSGTGCTTAPVVVTLTNDDTTTGVVMEGLASEITPRNDGTWSGTITVPASARNVDVMHQRGQPEYALLAWCGHPVVAAPEFPYGSVRAFDVTGPVTVPPRLTLSPSSGPPGTVVEVTGTGCTSSRAELATFLDLDLVEEVVVPVAGGSFRARVRVPADADPGFDLVVYADCGATYPSTVFAITG